ncbi:class I SAM-dependent methyltransferase [Pseudomarimonas salicorniae]|uniref:Class I SAM-dependent methyltransferase n=1 Tax=Pseudomarimonas salicorniae TaxID=2933270 RepID=A0ABT0GEA1_9GAMM|nr:class I SAM-dependent methyltransferase [Lysobacter sp. CAU 1642]
MEYVGLDASLPMLDLARGRWPAARFLHRDMRDLSGLADFDGVLSWDGSFHLTAAEQVRLIAAIGGCLRPHGAVLLTIGDAAGEVIGHVEGEAVYHASLAPDDYRSRFREAGFLDVEISLLDAACDGHSLCLAWR